MTLKIISSDQVLFEGNAKSVTLPGALGSFTILKNHASLVSVLVSGKIEYTDEDGRSESIPIKGGIADVDNNLVSVCIY